MVKSKSSLLGIKCTRNELEMIHNKARFHGFSTTSAYIRHLLFKEENLELTKKISDIHKVICGNSSRSVKQDWCKDPYIAQGFLEAAGEAGEV